MIKAPCDNQTALMFAGRAVKAIVVEQEEAIVAGFPDHSAAATHNPPYLLAKFHDEVGECEWDNTENATDAEQSMIALLRWSA